MKKITLDSLDQVGTGNNIVEDLLDQQVREIESILGENYRGMGNKVLSMFVQSGNRVQLSETAIAEELQNKKGLGFMMVQRILEQMLKANLLRKTPGGKYELSNNLLAQRAFQKVEAENRVLRTMRSNIRDRMARKELLDEHYLNYITSSLDLLDLTQEEYEFVKESRDTIQRKKRRRGFLLTLFVSALSLMAFWATMQTWEARKKTKELAVIVKELEVSRDSSRHAYANERAANEITQQSLDALKEEKDRADSLAKKATANAARANAEAARANINAKKAETERRRAESEKNSAISASQAALRAEAAAKRSAERAEELRIEAQKAEKNAQDARQRAIVFSNAVVALNAALKSQELDDPRLQALVARQAYNIVSESPELGLTRHPYIYNALYYAVKDVDNNLRFRNKAHEGAVRDIIFQDDGKRFFTTSSDGQVVQWDINEWNALGVPAHRQTRLPFEGDAVHNSLALSPNEDRLLVGGELSYLQVYNLKNKMVKRFDWPKGKSTEEIFSVGFLNNGSLVGMGRSHFYYLKDENTAIADIPKVSSRASTFLSTSQGVIALTVQLLYQELTKFNIEGLINGRLYRQEFGTRQINAQSKYGNLTSIAAQQASGEGLLAMGFQNGQIVLGKMNANTLEVREKLVPLFKQNQSPIVDITFSANGRYLAAASLDGRVTIWDLKNSEKDPTYQPLLLEDHEGWATSVCFTPDERFLLVGTKNGEVAFWNLEPRVYAEHLCNQLRINYLSPRYDQMDDEDWRRFFGTEIKQQRVCGGN
ncbi:hypothetical protein [Haliscomenobacter sp.]|uniref:WD40 repeat domain-containing protein n=1 Tax=Haliscomenobacter sp. TaxID=2717303 RepID=UPI003BACD226